MLLQFSLDSEFEARTKAKYDVATEYKHCLVWVKNHYCFIVSSDHRRPNRVLRGLRSFSNEAIYATTAVSNCNVKTAVLFH